MATTITAGNATNGAIISPDNTGILELKTGTGAGTTGLTINASQAATFAGTLQVGGVTANVYPIVSGTINAGGTNPFPSSSGPAVVDFTGIPSWAKRITVMFNGVSTSGTSVMQIQIGSGSVTTSGYAVSGSAVGASSVQTISYTSGFAIGDSNAATRTKNGAVTLSLLTGNTWAGGGACADSSSARTDFTYGSITLGGTLDRVRITTVNGTDLFDAGSVNILWE